MILLFTSSLIFWMFCFRESNTAVSCARGRSSSWIVVGYGAILGVSNIFAMECRSHMRNSGNLVLDLLKE